MALQISLTCDQFLPCFAKTQSRCIPGQNRATGHQYDNWYWHHRGSLSHPSQRINSGKHRINIATDNRCWKPCCPSLNEGAEAIPRWEGSHLLRFHRRLYHWDVASFEKCHRTQTTGKQPSWAARSNFPRLYPHGAIRRRHPCGGMRNTDARAAKWNVQKSGGADHSGRGGCGSWRQHEIWQAAASDASTWQSFWWLLLTETPPQITPPKRIITNRKYHLQD